jgi:hypothetical protein
MEFEYSYFRQYDTIVPPIRPDVVPIASPEMKQVYLDQVEWVQGVSNQFHVNEIALAMVGTTIAIGLWKLLQMEDTQKEKGDTGRRRQQAIARNNDSK